MMIVGAGASHALAAQGNNAFQPIGGRTSGMMTPGSLYKNQPINMGVSPLSNPYLSTPNQSGNRSISTLPQNTTVSQPLYKPPQPAAPLQPSPFTTTPQTTAAPRAPAFTPSLGAPATTPSRQPQFTTGAQFTPQPPPAFSTMSPSPQPPAYSVTPQFTPASSSPYGNANNMQSGPYSLKPSAKPIYTPAPQATVSQPSALGGASQPGPFSKSYQSFPMTGPQSTPPQPFQLTPPASTPLATPLVTPLVAPLMQPYYVAPSSTPQPPR
jgi:hypothetical protein